MTESGSPAGCTPVYNNGQGCVWNDSVSTFNTCEITNKPDPGRFTIWKEGEIVNTSFLEGIRNLSQFGLAIIALLMLGVGMVGFRRFA